MKNKGNIDKKIDKDAVILCSIGFVLLAIFIVVLVCNIDKINDKKNQNIATEFEPDIAVEEAFEPFSLEYVEDDDLFGNDATTKYTVYVNDKRDDMFYITCVVEMNQKDTTSDTYDIRYDNYFHIEIIGNGEEMIWFNNGFETPLDLYPYNFDGIHRYKCKCDLTYDFLTNHNAKEIYKAFDNQRSYWSKKLIDTHDYSYYKTDLVQDCTHNTDGEIIYRTTPYTNVYDEIAYYLDNHTLELLEVEGSDGTLGICWE